MIQNHLTSQVTSLELSERLRDLNVPQKSLFYYDIVNYDDGDGHVDTMVDVLYKDDFRFSGGIRKSNVSAFLSSELGEILGEGFSTAKECGVWEALSLEGSIYDIEGSLDGNEGFISENEAEARGLMLEYLIINGLIKL